MTSHTPGPWAAEETPQSWIVTFGDDGEQIVDHVYVEADAHLIAAAPELLAALEEVVRTEYGHFEEAPSLESLRALIAKAKGETPND